jgi:hypothetical protein
VYGPPSRLGYPIGKIRLYMSIPPAVGFGFLIFQASTALNLFTPIRQLYLLLGVTVGLLMGTLEARFVLQELSSNSETIVWKPLLVGIVLVCLPLLLVLAIFGAEEYLPFGAYFVLSAIPVYLATGGWFYAKFEKANQVRIFGSPFGFKYWKEPVEDLNARFYQFIRDAVTKQPLSIWWQVGYAKKFITLLGEKQDIEPSTQKELLELLRAMNRYRKIGLTALGIFLSVVFGFFLFFFLGAAGIISIPERQLLDIVGPGSGVILFGFFIPVWLMIKRFQKTIADKLSNLESDKLYSLL